MKPLYTEEEFKKSKSKDRLPCECYHCKSSFYLTKHQIQISLNINENRVGKYCSNECYWESKKSKIKIQCSNCNKIFEKLPNQIKKTKNHFCSQSCAAIYNNTHKTKGIRRSKLEIYFEKELRLLYPELKMDFNQTDAIDSELDIYIPSLKLAFELNGIFHYEPIYGEIKLSQIKNNDNRKIQACIERNIEFCIIDTSHQKYFKEQTSKELLNIITTIINNKKSSSVA